jgi:hypothetical protein
MNGGDDLLTYVNKHQELINRGGNPMIMISTTCASRIVIHLWGIYYVTHRDFVAIK